MTISRKDRLAQRFSFLQAIRSFFLKEGYLEADTNLLVSTPGMEENLQFIDAKGGNLSTCSLISSPEFGMKKIAAEGFEKIFYLGKSFRDEPLLPYHAPEFTMLEWYTADQTTEECQAFLKRFILEMVVQLKGSFSIDIQGRRINLAEPWKVCSIPTLFQDELNIQLTPEYSYESLRKDALSFKLTVTENDSWDDLFYKLFLNEIEGKFSQNSAVFLTDYPPSQAALAQIGAKGWAERFELYIGGIELANAFNELRDPIEQRHRFETVLSYRKKHNMPCYPIDEQLLEAIGKLPQTVGVALGVERLLMLLTGAQHISEVLSF